ncbi:MAG: DNA cytosine methyltransferase [Betaproteobacteria bacterium]
MNYINEINHHLIPKEPSNPLVLDLFAGCGGLALGFEAQGFETLGFEMNSDCCATYKNNLKGDCINIKLIPDYEFPKANIVIGGPPCQPFSVGGSQKGIEDSRDGFPVFLSAIKQAQPDIWMFENVRGLMYKNKWYLDEIIQKLEGMNYIVEYQLLNAVNYHVPQNRERIIVVGHRGNFKFPQKREVKITAGEAVSDLINEVPENAKYLTASMDAYVKKYEIASKCINPRDLHLNRPSRTITCRNLAGATGDMHRILLPDGRRRRMAIREAARIQSFPDWYKFVGGDTSVFNQIGNAVAPMFAFHLAKSVREYLNSTERFTNNQISERRNPSQLELMIND